VARHVPHGAAAHQTPQGRHLTPLQSEVTLRLYLLCHCASVRTQQECDRLVTNALALCTPSPCSSEGSCWMRYRAKIGNLEQQQWRRWASAASLGLCSVCPSGYRLAMPWIVS